MKVPAILGGWLKRIGNTDVSQLEKENTFEWKYLDEVNSRRLGLEMTFRPDEILYTELNNKWVGRFRFHTIPGSVLSAEHFSLNQNLDLSRKDFKKVLFSFLDKVAEIMEKENIPRMEIYIASPSITRTLTALGATVTYQQGDSSSLSWNFEDIKNIKLRRIKLLE